MVNDGDFRWCGDDRGVGNFRKQNIFVTAFYYLRCIKMNNKMLPSAYASAVAAIVVAMRKRRARRRSRKKMRGKYKCALRGMNKITFPSFGIRLLHFTIVSWLPRTVLYIMTPPHCLSQFTFRIYIPHQDTYTHTQTHTPREKNMI